MGLCLEGERNSAHYANKAMHGYSLLSLNFTLQGKLLSIKNDNNNKF